MRSSPPRVTLAQIAERTGTSTTTVSFVLNETGSVGEETRARVLAAAKDLGYLSAQRKRRRPQRKILPATNGKGSPPSANVALIWVNTTEGWRHTHLANILIHTISVGLEKQGGRLWTIFYNEDNGEPFPDLSGADAIFIAGSPSNEFTRQLPKQMPKLGIVCRPFDNDNSFIDIDSMRTGYSITQHLISHGHQRIGFVSNTRFHRSFSLRYMGYLQALDEAELSTEPDWTIRLRQPQGSPVETALPTSDIDPELAKLLSLPESRRPTALFAANDWIAAAIYQYANRNAIRIPDDLSVIGCDNDPGICDFLKPSLTTHTVPYVEMAHEAVHWISSTLAGTPPHAKPGIMLFQGKVVDRQSVNKLLP